MKVMMRSNDVVLGFTNDLFTFTMFQEYVSSQTGIPLGTYSHFASSFHIYERDAIKYSVIEYDGHWPSIMEQMPFQWNPNPVWGLLSHIRNTTSIEQVLMLGQNGLTERYDRNLYYSSAAVYYRKDPNVWVLYPEIYDQSLQRVVEFWIAKERI